MSKVVWQIEEYPEKSNNFFIRKIVDDRPVESYRSKDAAGTILDIACILNGFEPPRYLVHLDKQS